MPTTDRNVDTFADVATRDSTLVQVRVQMWPLDVLAIVVSFLTNKKKYKNAISKTFDDCCARSRASALSLYSGLEMTVFDADMYLRDSTYNFIRWTIGKAELLNNDADTQLRLIGSRWMNYTETLFCFVCLKALKSSHLCVRGSPPKRSFFFPIGCIQYAQNGKTVWCDCCVTVIFTTNKPKGEPRVVCQKCGDLEFRRPGSKKLNYMPINYKLT